MVTPGSETLLRDLTAFVAVGILVSGLDDLFIDVYYYASELHRRLRPERFPAIAEADLKSLPEQPIAIMIPAWHEDAVIGRMLRNTLRTVDYKEFHLFVGTYPNDEATMHAVAQVAEEDPRVHRVVLPHDGPTNKADCLNWIIEGIRQYDKKTGRRFEILMLHDCEDMVHPLSFRLMNRFIPEASMVQLPVIPFEAPLPDLTAGSYLDEFAESHVKDMVVRERVSGMVPSAGVGTGFARDAIERLAEKHDHQVFNVHTFTEDYDLAFRLNAIGEPSILLRFFVERTASVKSGLLRRRERLRVVRELVGTREYFPSRFKDAVRQKARWTLGIVFHGWKERGWEGGLALRYMIWRDRKTLVTNSVNMLGYAILLDAVVGGVAARPMHAPRLHIPAESWVWDVIAVDGVLLLNRCLQRTLTISRVSAWSQAGLSLPRIIWGNVINFFAVAKATYLFARTAITGKKPVWAKTAHAFPSEEQLLGYKRKLGDLLLESRLLSLANLSHALKTQEGSGRLLGEILVDLGYVPEEAVVNTLAVQLKVEARLLRDEDVPPDALDVISECACREHLMILLDGSSEPALIAAAVHDDQRMRHWLDSNFGRPYRVVLAGRRNIVELIERRALGAALPAAPTPGPPLAAPPPLDAPAAPTAAQPYN